VLSLVVKCTVNVGYLQTNTDEASRTSLALRAAESAKDQRINDHRDRDSLVSINSTTSADSSRTNIARSAFTPVAISPALAGNKITEVSRLLFVLISVLHNFCCLHIFSHFLSGLLWE